MKKNTHVIKSRSLLCWLVGMLLPLQLFAQQNLVQGIVKDATGEAVIGANVLVKNTTRGTITDFDGKFKLEAKEGEILEISFIGYKTIEIPATRQMNITLKDDTQLLDDVVIIGYGSVKKEDLSGSVVAIKAEEMNRGAVTSPQELIQGKIPGLHIQAGDGQPGAGATIRIRGGASLRATNDPLIVIDGIPISNDAAPGTPNALATINPNDIETFTVLKDASATAIYGSRASNGVIIITTKKGTNTGVKVSYTGTFTMKDPYKRIETLSANQFREVINNQYSDGSAAGDAALAIVNQYPDQSTDWQDAIYQTGLSTDQNISVSGKAGVLPFRVSLGYNNEKGTIKTSKYNRYTASVNLNPKFFDNHLAVDINVKGTINKTRYTDDNVANTAAFFDPTKPIYDEETGFNGYWNWVTGGLPSTLSAVNPLSMLYDKNNKGTTKRSLGNIQLNYKIHGLEDLNVNLNVGYDVSKATGSDFANLGSFQAAKDSDFKDLGQGKTWNNLRRNHLLDFYLNYEKELPTIKSRINVMGGYSWQHFYFSDFDYYTSNSTDGGLSVKEDTWEYIEDEHHYAKVNQQTKLKEKYLVSFFGRLNYHFMERYLLTATIRRDGSSNFTKDNRWGMFPSVAAAWTLLNESFMESTKEVLSNLKLRVGYGITGQQEFDDYYLHLTTYSLGNNPNGQYLGTYLLKPNKYNQDLKWEETATYNIGLDYGFLNNRISGSVEYYWKHTKDLLSSVSTAAGTNFSNIYTANIGEMKNKGLEFNVEATAIQSKNFTWKVGYNVTFNDSEITKLTASYNPDYPGLGAGSANYGSNATTIQKHQVGELPSTFWLYQQVYDANGKPIQNAFVDRNNDGVITEADRYFTGKNPMAKTFMGFSSQLIYKNWDLGFNLRASLGNYVYNALEADNCTTDSFGNQGIISNYYKGIYRTGFTKSSRTEQRASDLFLENASFLKMDNITLGYSFDKLFSQKISGRISASVQNVFTITNYSGLDPECSAIDQNTYPRPRIFTLGLNLNF
ncbi:TonB-dependent receptor [Bacteroides sp. 224]|uniref:SusC/RagA family TonB-linked outer membrane protein n=1 Tax=Bacteroides sp. 224 TaxID=2302936 RepID=UPI0013D38C29|nr:TonB-dependent receptor [Bacteroides sp. 224]NDV63697.1 TonB-dependent receptor [Bacteroides sp. 224]